ncbi:hypothetical protein ACGFZK_20340 [Streptomyces sp. NPDC048257]|uniref:hypothetical protein n=1 Tax=Streptomyces sp. NPDC048257 TaxID=3365526 RepID=UPI0037145D50
MALVLFVLVLALMIVGLVATLTASAVLGYATVAVSRRLPLGARITLLVALAAGSAAAWVSALGVWAVSRPANLTLSFTTTVVSGAVFLTLEARKRRAPRTPHPAWQVRG